VTLRKVGRPKGMGKFPKRVNTGITVEMYEFLIGLDNPSEFVRTAINEKIEKIGSVNISKLGRELFKSEIDCINKGG
jgi:hypothetical protein